MIQRDFFPGEKWMFMKIYCTPAISDRVISEVIRPAVRRLMNRGVAESWFFIRYSDPDYHLRLRVCLRDPKELWTALDAVNRRLRPFVRDSLVRSVVLDVYSREIERYGASVMADTERIFCVDSEAVAAIVAEAGDDRWKYAFPLVDTLLKAAGMDVAARYELMGQVCKGFEAEFGHTADSEHSLSMAYRKKRKTVEDYVGLAAAVSDRLKEALALREGRISGIIRDRAKYNIRSLIHMSLNRLFTVDNRRSEYVTCDFLRRYYKSAVRFGPSGAR